MISPGVAVVPQERASEAAITAVTNNSIAPKFNASLSEIRTWYRATVGVMALDLAGLAPVDHVDLALERVVELAAQREGPPGVGDVQEPGRDDQGDAEDDGHLVICGEDRQAPDHEEHRLDRDGDVMLEEVGELARQGGSGGDPRDLDVASALIDHDPRGQLGVNPAEHPRVVGSPRHPNEQVAQLQRSEHGQAVV